MTNTTTRTTQCTRCARTLNIEDAVVRERFTLCNRCETTRHNNATAQRQSLARRTASMNRSALRARA